MNARTLPELPDAYVWYVQQDGLRIHLMRFSCEVREYLYTDKAGNLIKILEPGEIRESFDSISLGVSHVKFVRDDTVGFATQVPFRGEYMDRYYQVVHTYRSETVGPDAKYGLQIVNHNQAPTADDIASAAHAIYDKWTHERDIRANQRKWGGFYPPNALS